MKNGFRFALLLGAACLAGCGGSGGGSDSSGSSGSSSGGSGGGSGPRLVQYNVGQTQQALGANSLSVPFKATTAAGSVLWVAVTLSDYAGAHTLAVSDTQGNAFTLLDQVDDAAPGSQTVAHFYASGIRGDSSSPDVVTVSWGNENYDGVLVAEVAGASATAPLVGHSKDQQDRLAAGTNNVTSGPISVASTQAPALLVALSMNTSGGTSDIGGSGYGGPAAGSGLTTVASVWKWGVNLATFATASVSGTGTTSALFSAPDTDNFVTVAALFH